MWILKTQALTICCNTKITFKLMHSLANNNTVSGTLYKVIVKIVQLFYYSYYTTITIIWMRCNQRILI